jgi:hypothetical protein
MNHTQAEAAARQLEQLRRDGGKEIAGPRSEKPVIDEPRLLAEHGGRAGDWTKVTSRAIEMERGMMETHAYRNTKTGEIVEPELKFQGGK